eukprot:363132-Chlamydomonas_euryale.AAC.5
MCIVSVAPPPRRPWRYSAVPDDTLQEATLASVLSSADAATCRGTATLLPSSLDVSNRWSANQVQRSAQSK